VSCIFWRRAQTCACLPEQSMLFSSKCQNFPSAFLCGVMSSAAVVSCTVVVSRARSKGSYGSLIIQMEGHIAPHHCGLGNGTCHLLSPPSRQQGCGQGAQLDQGSGEQSQAAWYCLCFSFVHNSRESQQRKKKRV